MITGRRVWVVASLTAGNDAEVGGERIDLSLLCAQIGQSAAVNENHRRTVLLSMYVSVVLFSQMCW